MFGHTKYARVDVNDATGRVRLVLVRWWGVVEARWTPETAEALGWALLDAAGKARDARKVGSE